MATLGAPIQFSRGPAPASPIASRLFVSPLSPPLTSYAPSSTFIASRFATPNVMDASRKLQSITSASDDGGLPLDMYYSSDSAPRTMPTPPLGHASPPVKARRSRTRTVSEQQEEQQSDSSNNENRTSSKRKRSSATLSGDEAELTLSGLQTPFNNLSQSNINKGGFKRRRSNEDGLSKDNINDNDTQSSDADEPVSSPTKQPNAEPAQTPRRSSSSLMTRPVQPDESTVRNPNTTPENKDRALPEPTTPIRGLAPECVPDGLERSDFYSRTPPKPVKDWEFPWTDDEDRHLIDVVISQISLTDEQLSNCAQQIGRTHAGSVGDRLRRLVNFGCIGLKRSLGTQHDRRRTLPSDFTAEENTCFLRRRRSSRPSRRHSRPSTLNPNNH